MHTTGRSVDRPRTSHRARRWSLALLVAAASALLAPLAVSAPAWAGAGLNGAGSSFAQPEVTGWVTDTSKPPYNLNVNYTGSSSGDGRFQFANDTVDYAVSDIPYQPYPYDTKSPTFPFIYIPVTAGGLAFMYHINGLSGTLQLSSYSICAVMTGGVQYWDDPVIKADNPGVSLPHTLIHVVTRSDLAGTNFVLQEYCIDEQPALWAAFVNSPVTRSTPGQVDDLSATQPRSDWPLFASAIPESGSAAAANTVSIANNDGYITAVETAYALQRNAPVASVKNANGVYTQPTAVDVASALAYANQLPNGTHELNFNGAGPHVYNPSTYSYLLTPTTGWSAAKGATMSQFVDYALSLGQKQATTIGYASLGLSLEQYGVNAVQADVPGAVAPTADEKAAFQCGDLTPSEVQAGQTTPTCGVVNTQATIGATATTGSTSAGAAGSSTAAGSSGGTGASGGSGGTSGGVGGTGTQLSANAGVGLPGATGLSYTGGNPWPPLVLGIVLLMVGVVARRRFRRAPAGGGEA